ncbi:MAG: hypothetical protein ABJB01_06125 [Rudaea sp.]
MHLAIFRFRLSVGHSIGRVELKKLWAAACRSDDVSVSRVESASGFGEMGHTYSLQGPARMPDGAEIEQRIRSALNTLRPKATIVLIRPSSN